MTDPLIDCYGQAVCDERWHGMIALFAALPTYSRVAIGWLRGTDVHETHGTMRGWDAPDGSRRVTMDSGMELFVTREGFERIGVVYARTLTPVWVGWGEYVPEDVKAAQKI